MTDPHPLLWHSLTAAACRDTLWPRQSLTTPGHSLASAGYPGAHTIVSTSPTSAARSPHENTPTIRVRHKHSIGINKLIIHSIIVHAGHGCHTRRKGTPIKQHAGNLGPTSLGAYYLRHQFGEPHALSHPDIAFSARFRSSRLSLRSSSSASPRFGNLQLARSWHSRTLCFGTLWPPQPITGRYVE